MNSTPSIRHYATLSNNGVLFIYDVSDFFGIL